LLHVISSERKAFIGWARFLKFEEVALPQTLEVFQKRHTHPLLGNGLEVSLRLLLLDSTGALGLAVRATLGNGALAATPPHANAVDHKACNTNGKKVKLDI
jgi:hypothetical protein